MKRENSSGFFWFEGQKKTVRIRETSAETRNWKIFSFFRLTVLISNVYSLELSDAERRVAAPGASSPIFNIQVKYKSYSVSILLKRGFFGNRDL